VRGPWLVGFQLGEGLGESLHRRRHLTLRRALGVGAGRGGGHRATSVSASTSAAADRSTSSTVWPVAAASCSTCARAVSSWLRSHRKQPSTRSGWSWGVNLLISGLLRSRSGSCLPPLA